MASTRDLRRRIRSIKNTAQITKAMQMVSATKMRKAQGQAMSGRPYSDTLHNALSLVATSSNGINHPLATSVESTKTGVIVCSSDKGLCGALNANLIRFISHDPTLNKRDQEAGFYTIGKKVRDFIVRSQRQLEADFENHDKVSFLQAIRIRKFVTTEFLSGKIGQCFILYPDFISTLRQEPKLVKILPINDLLTEFLEEENNNEISRDFIFEPDQNALLDYALNHLLDTKIYQALLETKASEYSARMIAMQNATNNAKDLVDDLTLTYNQARQENITRELLEITSATSALS